MTATSVTIMPRMSATIPVRITVRAAVLRCTRTAIDPKTAKTKRTRPPTTIDVFMRLRTSAGPSAPKNPASAQTANSTGATTRTG